MKNNFDQNIEYFNLTIPQENIWITEQLNPNTNINNIYGTFTINKPMDLELLKLAINRVIETNDALRIRITEQNSKTLQYLVNYEYEDIPVYFLEENEKEKTTSIINAIGLEHINILNSKLYDFRIIYKPDEVCITVKMHHIIADAWSMAQLFVQHVVQVYEEVENNLISEKKPSYLNYISKNEEYKVSEKFIRDQKFWEKYVKTLNCKNEFTTSKDKRSKRIEKRIEKNLYIRISNFCKDNNISEYSFFLGVISTYFSKTFSNNNLVIGTPFLNRKKANKEFNMMGMFVATLPIGINVDKNLTFIDLCKQIAATNMSCFKHCNFPYSEIQQEYFKFSGDNTNLYEIAFSYQINNLEEFLDSNIYKNTWIPNGYQAYPLFISYTNHFGEHQLCYDYILQCFNEIDIDNIHDRFIHIINQIIRKTEIQIENIKILSKNDLEKLQIFNSTGDINPSEDTIVKRFEKIVQKNKSKVALKYNDTEITYSELNKKVNSVANFLLEKGVRKGTPISIIFDKCPEMFITMLGIIKAGCYYIPILPEEEQNRAEFIIQNSESQYLITEKKYSTQIGKNIIENQLIIDDLLNGNTNNPIVNMKPTDICYLIYTSGSTGTPKGVTLTHQNIIAFLDSTDLHDDIKFKENDIYLSLLKYSFDGSACDIYSSLLHGAKLVIIPKNIELNPELVAKLIENEGVTRFIAVPTWIDKLVSVSKSNKINLSSIRFIGLGGEALQPQKLQYLYETYPNLKIYNVYGPTETTIFTTIHKINNDDIEKNYSPIGHPIPGSRALIMNSNNEVLPINVKGELVIFNDSTSIKNVTNGYFKLDTKTKKRFIKFINPVTDKIVIGYKTGDLAKINHSLELDFFGRNDDFKKINGGYLVSLNEIETKIQKTLGNSFDIAVVCVPIRNVNSIILFVSKKTESINITISDIDAEISKNLTFYMRPKQIIELDKIPITNNGKFNKKQLEKDALNYLEHKNTLLPPTNKTEQKIYDAVKEITNCDFSITDDFEDDLNIDSLNMTILYSKLNNNKISVQDLYNYPSVKDLAYLMRKEFSSDENIYDENIPILNATNKMDLSKVLLTGTTGFVGIHLLKELVDNESTEKIYCIVRQKLNSSSEERFNQIIHNYFTEEYCKIIRKKCVILNGDLRKQNLGLDFNTYNRTFKDVKTIINAAANVKHIGKYHTSYVDNVETVDNLIKICTNFNISLAHISTLSLNGYNNLNVKEEFTENTLNINQTFNKNPYLISKYEAEQLILKNISETNLNAKIFRIGNIMPRITDGEFQTNYNQNGFILGITAIGQLQCVTEKILNTKINLTPVDECCKCIMKILNSDFCNTIYHVENDKKVKFSSIIDIFKDRNIEFKILDEKTFEKKLISDYSIGTEYLKSMFYTDYNKYSQNITLEILNNLDFEWQHLNKEYLNNIINISMKIRRNYETY